MGKQGVRRPVIAGNWKMHMTCAQSREFMEAFLPLIADTPDDRDLVLAPPFTALSTMAELSQNSRVCLSSQNVHWEGQGAFTGEISPAMLKEHGVTHTIVGHSEPRKYFSESDEQINHRARSSQSNGLIPIVCVGLIRSWVGSPDLVIQYGGSVKPSNIDELMGMSDIDGVLVGGASLEPESFGRIANYQTA